jgi:hypothetical protein
MKIVYAISAPGHVNPMLGIVRFWWDRCRRPLLRRR